MYRRKQFKLAAPFHQSIDLGPVHYETCDDWIPATIYRSMVLLQGDTKIIMDKFKTFWTDLFTSMDTEDSIVVLVFLGVSFFIGLLFGAWVRAGKIKRLKRELVEKNLGAKSLRTQYDSLVEQFEKKEEDLKIAETRTNEAAEDIIRLTNERNHFQTELKSAREEMERLQEENLNYVNRIKGGIITDTNTVVDTSSSDDNGLSNSINVIDEVQNDPNKMIKHERLV